MSAVREVSSTSYVTSLPKEIINYLIEYTQKS